jgi:fluoroacetyl-CoA thioesterase
VNLHVYTFQAVPTLTVKFSTQMSASEPEEGATATAQLFVGIYDLASALVIDARDAFPAVFATARLVALMEIASARLLNPLLGIGQLSVGVSLDITHSASTPPGATATATARYLGRNNKLYKFEAVAFDKGGDIGCAQHQRAIVDVGRLESGAARRVAK